MVLGHLKLLCWVLIMRLFQNTDQMDCDGCECDIKRYGQWLNVVEHVVTGVGEKRF
jgi:hypothetical protein